MWSSHWKRLSAPSYLIMMPTSIRNYLCSIWRPNCGPVLVGAACQTHTESYPACLINDGKGQPNKLCSSPFPDNRQRCRVHCFQSALDLSGPCYRLCLLQVNDVAPNANLKWTFTMELNAQLDFEGAGLNIQPWSSLWSFVEQTLGLASGLRENVFCNAC